MAIQSGRSAQLIPFRRKASEPIMSGPIMSEPPLRETLPRETLPREPAPSHGPATILFFTGIRYERMATSPAAGGQDDPDRPRDPAGGPAALATASPQPRNRRPRKRA
jgi:hypothetical protein